MLNPDLKKKIMNTISQYEVKCNKMQLQINSLKNAINHLVINPIGINYDFDEHLSKLKEELDTEFEPSNIEKKVKRLSEKLDKLQKQKSENVRQLHGLIRQGAESICRIANKSQDKRAVTKLQKMLDTEMESHAILIHFNEVLTQCISSIVRELDDLSSEQRKKTIKDTDGIEVSFRVNDSLQQLLNHLSIPQNLDEKRESIKISLENKLTDDDLSRIIDGLTELVVDAFSVEQNRFKGFLQQLTNQLTDFEMFLKTSISSQQQSAEDSRNLESGIQDNIQQIKTHIDNSKSVEDLSSKIMQNLKLIGERLKQFRTNETKREKAYEKQISELQEKLRESEQNADEIFNLLSYQKYRINHDSLTGLPNRESYDEHILEAMHRWKRSDKPLTIAVCDIDHFKRINDNFGHLAGDKVLKKVASMFKGATRATDFIARVGGEEFVFIFEHTTSKDAKSILEKLRKSIQDCLFYYHEKKVDVTVSFGLTSVVKEDDVESLFIRADKAMYKAKNSGRNRIEIE